MTLVTMGVGSQALITFGLGELEPLVEIAVVVEEIVEALEVLDFRGRRPRDTRSIERRQRSVVVEATVLSMNSAAVHVARASLLDSLLSAMTTNVTVSVDDEKRATATAVMGNVVEVYDIDVAAVVIDARVVSRSGLTVLALTSSARRTSQRR